MHQSKVLTNILKALKSGLFLSFFFAFFLPQLSLAVEEINPGEQTYYTVKKGDSLSKISRRYGIDLKELVAVNHIQNPNKIRVGQTIIIPRSYVAPKPVQPIPAPQVYTPPPKTQQEMKPEVVETAPVLTPTQDDIVVEEIYEEDVYVHEEPYQEWIGAGIGWWFGSLDAQARVSLGGIIGTEIDLVDDLGVDDSVGIPVVNAWLQPLSWLKIQAEYMAADVDGQRAIDEEIVFNGETFSITDNVRGELEIDRFSGWVEINPFNGDWGYVGVMVGGEYVHLEGILSSDLVGSISEELDAGTVTFGGQIGINLTPELQLRARGRGMTFDIEDVEVDVFDIQGGLSYTLFDHFEIAAYYRYLSLDVKADDDEGDLTLQGPMISGSLKI